jgi:hypothetical protein
VAVLSCRANARDIRGHWNARRNGPNLWHRSAG